ncbi:unnamed protein product [Phyllotreta striolata]|uniref:Nose resistant-to-fluoxetine protein N-terminal domain-containing protein n=1 Tax=Phyllotreta striolata TaxID=444603 RepID=A0A9N9TAC3_PHYSR|nr:unnamed protein product [Phyllotreta striolata]
MSLYFSWTSLLLLVSALAGMEARRVKLNILPPFMQKIINQKVEHILEVAGGNSQCTRDMRTVVNEALRMKQWALEMIDATAKPPTGLLAGNIFMHGNFDQCLNIEENIKGNVIRGQYCTVFLTSSKSAHNMLPFTDVSGLPHLIGIKTSNQTADLLRAFKVSYGVCVPHSCTIGNIQKLWDYFEHAFGFPLHFNFVNEMCSTKNSKIEPLVIDTYVYYAFGLYAAFLLLITGYDVIFHQNSKNKEDDNFWVSFSVFTNAKKLFRINDEQEGLDYLSAISGIKVMSMLWVLYGHRVVLNVMTGVTNFAYMLKWKTQLFTAFTLSASLSVDTFLMLSGLLLSYGILSYKRMLPKMRKIPVVPFYLYRFLRLSPALLALILFNISIFKNLNSGPIWPLQATKTVRVCSKLWFHTLFFVNNLVDVNYQCLDHAWYLAVDSQLYFISPIVLSGLLTYPARTILTCIGVCLISAIYTFVITMKNNYGAIYFEGNQEYLNNIYISTLVRMPPWFIGIIFGYIIYNYRNRRLNKIVNCLCWFSSTSVIVGLIMVHLVFVKSNEYSAVNSALFNSMARQLWSVAVAVLLFLCTVNREGIINKFLSMSVFRVVVRMSYSVYLTQEILLYYLIIGKRQSHHFSDLTNIHQFLGDLILVLLLACVWCLAFESPFIVIGRYFFKKGQSQLLKRKEKTNRKRNKSVKTKDNYLVCVYKYQEKGDLSRKKLL